MKHHTRWQFIQNVDDTLTATSPAGHAYLVRPQGLMKPAPRQLVALVAATAAAATTPEEELGDCPF